jgi:DNA-binding NarL/FixJ family response regulator
MNALAILKPIPVTQISVLLAEDHANFRKSLKLLVEIDGDIKVVGQAKNGREAVQLTLKLQPDVVIMDIAMPLLNGLQATRLIIESSPATRVLILSSHPDPEYIEQAMLYGASGYLIKQSSAPFIADAIREVLKGKTFFSASISKRLCDESRKVFVKRELLKKKVLRPPLSGNNLKN